MSTDTELTFFCDKCDAVLEGSVAALAHYKICTVHEQESEEECLYIPGTSQQYARNEAFGNKPLSPVKVDDKELLISEVFCREPLWNSLIPYAERSFKITSALWVEVDIALGVHNGSSQKIFKSLRDRYVRLLAEEKTPSAVAVAQEAKLIGSTSHSSISFVPMSNTDRRQATSRRINVPSQT
ncbi:uncharacterized protein [Polyergus mexicanus]|uniref:uncharacterized protein n=1 Tax=Polyergus mexicanus TaxID=615972 RepID=UPI0038B43311